MSSRPDWVDAIADRIPDIRALNLTRFVPPADFNGRERAVLILFGETNGFLDLVIIVFPYHLYILLLINFVQF